MKRIERIERYAAREPLAGVEPEKYLVHKPDRFAHRGNGQAGDRADDHGQHDDAQFPGADDGAQTVRDFEVTAECAH